MPLTTEILRSQEELAAIAAEWATLWACVPEATPFQSPLWLLPWWRHFSPGKLQTVAVRRDRQLVGLAPLYLEENGCRGRLLPLGISLSDYLDFLLEPAWRAQAFAAIFERITRACPGAAWSLEELPVTAHALMADCASGLASHVEPQSACPVLTLHNDLKSTIPGRKYRKVRMAWNRARRRGAVEIAAIDPDQTSGFLETLFELHGRRWQSRGETGVLASEQVRRFHRDVAPALLQAGIAQLWQLRIGGRTAGAYYGFLHGDRTYAYLGGFDPAFDHESPGTILIAHAIEAAIRAGAREFDFLRGREAYKYDWGATDRLTYRRIIAPSGAGALAHAS